MKKQERRKSNEFIVLYERPIFQHCVMRLLCEVEQRMALKRKTENNPFKYF